MRRFALTAIALFVAASQAQAQTAPLRGDILAQCPALAQELPELLASTKQAVDRHGSVQLALRIGDQGQLAVEHVAGTPAYRSATRQAVEGLRCPAAPAQRYSLTVRFADEAPAPATAPAAGQLAGAF